ncbi:MAG: hypothetical protein HFF17_13500 [Oscillospiraceae bacterium]|nr:hypothetical protein [Oscillospiraceae bacterium]
MVNSIIAKANGRNKVIDFRDGLVPAWTEDYAALHGTGGKNHAPVSVIKIYICDYSNGKGDKSLTINANIGTDLCEQIFEVCKGNLGSQVVAGDLPELVDQRSVNHAMIKNVAMNFGILNKCLTILGRLAASAEDDQAKAPSIGLIAKAASNLLGKVKDKATEEGPPVSTQPVIIQRHMDFNYAQDRVHAFGSGIKEGDLVPVHRLQIFHQTYRQDGAASNYPWTVKIINAKAKVHFQATGATSFSSSTMTDVKTAFIQLSDADMFRIMSRVTHYINVWENTIAAEIVRRGREQRAKEQKAQHNPYFDASEDDSSNEDEEEQVS